MIADRPRRTGALRTVAVLALVLGLASPALGPARTAEAEPSRAVAESVRSYEAARAALAEAEATRLQVRRRLEGARQAWDEADSKLAAADTRLARQRGRSSTLYSEYFMRHGAQEDVASDSIRLAIAGSVELVQRLEEFRDALADDEEEARQDLDQSEEAYANATADQEAVLAEADRAGALADGALDDAGAPELPALAYVAYRDAATRANDAHPDCSLSSSVLAGIGMLTSGHARDPDGTIDHSGRVEASTGASTLLGGLDAAVGPMQITEAAWSAAATDGDGDGAVSRKDFFDAASTTAEAMCASGASLTEIGPLEAAVGALFGEGQQTTVALGIARRYAAVADLDMGPVPDDPRTVLVDGSPQFDVADTALLRGDVAAMIAWAMTRVGTPYSQCLGPAARPQDPICPPGTNRFGVGFFDCSGFVSNAYRRIGLSIPLTTYAMEADQRFMSTRVSDGFDLSVMRPGDVFLMEGHTGMYVGDGMIVHAIGRGLTLEPVPRWVANGTIAVLRPVDLL